VSNSVLSAKYEHSYGPLATARFFLFSAAPFSYVAVVTDETGKVVREVPVPFEADGKDAVFEAIKELEEAAGKGSPNLGEDVLPDLAKTHFTTHFAR
jgi:hypothetical protein